MDSVITGKVWKFGDDINTDIISPAEYMDASYEVIGKHAMERAFPGFADAIARGDIIVAGKNFGSGSSRETAQIALIYAGVGAVIAKDFARIFFRNCINVGLPVVNFADTDKLNQGDEIRVDFLSGVIEDLTTGKRFTAAPFPPFIQKIIAVGGIENFVREKIAGKA